MQRVAVLVLAGIVIAGGDDLPEGLVLQCRLGDEVHVIGGGVVVVIVHTAGIDKMGVHRPQFGSPLVHHLGKVVQAPIAHIVAEHHGGLVARRQHGGIEQLSGAEALPPEDSGQRSAGAAQGILDVELEFDLRRVQIGDIFQSQ